jgi:site-specific DNA-methyltransferase (adenine-specific)
MNIIFNEDCLETMKRKELENQVDLVITSPPYNTSRVGDKDVYNSRYDSFKDKISDEDYIKWTVDIFNGFDKVLKKDGCVLYNMSYSSENTHLMWLVVAELIKNTPFTTADCIIWKKSNAIPNNRSKNKLTRIIEYIFVFCRKKELSTFHANKKVMSRIEKTGQANYENVYNYLEARNNDGSNKLNKATYSTELVVKLMNIYGTPMGLVYDPFMGVGTTAKGALEFGMNYVGSELSKEQVDFSNESLHQVVIVDEPIHRDIIEVTEDDDFWNS